MGKYTFLREQVYRSTNTEYDDVRLKSKGVRFMNPSHIHPHYYFPSSQEANLSSAPFHEANYSHTTLDERQFGSFFPQMPPPPPGFQGGQPPFAPPGQGPTAGPPTSPPPSFVPPQQVQQFAVDPGGIARCLFRYTYVWLRGFEQFWFYPTFVDRNSVAGYRWTGFRWVYFGISLRQIQSFTCY
jgi:hypothetical protein